MKRQPPPCDWCGKLLKPQYAPKLEEPVISPTEAAAGPPPDYRKPFKGWGYQANGHFCSLHCGFEFAVSIRSGQPLRKAPERPKRRRRPRGELAAIMTRIEVHMRHWENDERRGVADIAAAVDAEQRAAAKALARLVKTGRIDREGTSKDTKYSPIRQPT